MQAGAPSVMRGEVVCSGLFWVGIGIMASREFQGDQPRVHMLDWSYPSEQLCLQEKYSVRSSESWR